MRRITELLPMSAEWAKAMVPLLFILAIALRVWLDKRRLDRQNREYQKAMDAEVDALYEEFPFLNESCPREKR